MQSPDAAATRLDDSRMDRLPWAHGHQRKAIEAREKFSPLAACWTSELGGLNAFVHTWVYKDLNERARAREDARKGGGPWPPQAGVRPVRQANKLLIPASFSPVR
jgi:NIPSNAP